MKLLTDNQDKIDWYCLSENTSTGAIELFEQNPEKINWDEIWCNPNIFYNDYCGLK